MKAPHLHGFITGLLTSGCIVFLISASPHSSDIVTGADWPESARKALSIDKKERFQKTSAGQMDLFESMDRENPFTVVVRRDHPSPLVVFGSDGVRIHDSSGRSISASSIDTPSIIDRFSYSTERQGVRTSYTDPNMDGIIDVATTERSNYEELNVRYHIGDEWYESTKERYFEGEWFVANGVELTRAIIAKKEEIKHHTRAITPTGLKIVKFTGGVPSFVDSVK
jgi:hypothetical protein